MVITIIAEPRTGSTNLGKWFLTNKEFTVLFEPLNKTSTNYKKGESVNEWKYNTNHFLIKEIYTPDICLTELIQFSDKIIILYRENKKEQSESWVMANSTDNWTESWRPNDKIKYHANNTKIDYFYNLVDGFNTNYVSNENYFKISYEELYYNDGLNKIIDYLNLDCVKNVNFPFGQKYRIDSAPNKLI
jgi:LPS sulfotransferase NodH